MGAKVKLWVHKPNGGCWSQVVGTRVLVGVKAEWQALEPSGGCCSQVWASEVSGRCQS